VYHDAHFGGPAIGSRESRRLRSDVANLTRGQAQHALLVDSGAAHELRIFEELEQRRDISHLKSHCPWLIISNASTVDGAGQSPWSASSLLAAEPSRRVKFGMKR